MTNKNFFIGKWLVEPGLGQLTRGDDKIRIEPQVMKVLCYLAARRGEVVPKQELIDALWSARCISDAALARCISCIRVALEDSRQHPKYIQTIPKVGYRWVAATTIDETTPKVSRKVARWTMGVAAACVVAAVALLDLAKPVYPKSLIVSEVVLLSQLQEPTTDRNIRAARNVANHWLDDGLASLSDEVVISKVSGTPVAESYSNGSHFLRGEIEFIRDSIELRFELTSNVDGKVFWNREFSLNDTSVFAAVEQVVDDVYDALDVPRPADGENVNRRPPSYNVLAFDAYLQGKQHFYQANRESNYRAIGYFEDALENDPECAVCLAVLSTALTLDYQYWGGDRFFEARRAAQKALELDPDHAETNFAMGKVLARTEEPDRAMPYFQVAIEKDPRHAWAVTSNAYMYFRQGDYDRAEQFYLRAIELTPNDYHPMNQLGSMYYNNGDADKAEYWLSRAYQNNPLNRRTTVNLAVLDIHDNRIEDAVRRCDKLASPGLNNSARPHYVCGRIAVAATYIAGDFVAALNRIDELSLNWPEDAAIRLAKAQILLAMNRQQQAIELIDGTVEDLQRDAEVNECDRHCYWLIGVGFGLKGENTEAFAHFDRAKELGRHNLLWDKVDPLLIPIRNDERYQHLLASTDGR